MKYCILLQFFQNEPRTLLSCLLVLGSLPSTTPQTCSEVRKLNLSIFAKAERLRFVVFRDVDDAQGWCLHQLHFEYTCRIVYAGWLIASWTNRWVSCLGSSPPFSYKDVWIVHVSILCPKLPMRLLRQFAPPIVKCALVDTGLCGRWLSYQLQQRHPATYVCALLSSFTERLPWVRQNKCNLHRFLFRYGPCRGMKVWRNMLKLIIDWGFSVLGALLLVLQEPADASRDSFDSKVFH